MSLKKVLVVNKTFPTVGLEILRKKFETIIIPYDDADTEIYPEIKKQMKGIDALVWNTKFKLNAEILDLAGPGLQVVSTMSSGVDHVDIPELKRRNIPLGKTLGVLDNAVADIAVGLLIAATRRFKEGVRDIESGKWDYGVQWTLGQDIANSTVGVIGLGGIGQAIVRRLRGFDVGTFLYCGRSEKPEAKELKAEYVTLHQLLNRSDYIIVSCPSTAETKHLINDNTIQMMKRNAVIVNIARGELIDQEALARALKENRIFAAGLDVVTPEPIPKDHELVKLPNCYILPHLGSATKETRDEMAKITANNIVCGLSGEKMPQPAY